MKTRRVLIFFALCAAVIASACGSAQPSAATVQLALTSGSSTTTASSPTGSAPPSSAPADIKYGSKQKIDRSDFEKELKALNDNKELQAASGGGGLSGAGKKTVDPRLSAGWLTAVIYDRLITGEFERRHLKITSDDTEAATAQLGTQFGDPKVAAAFPKWFRDRLVARNARAVAVRAALSGLDFSEASLHKYFDEHKAEFGQICLSHILVKTKAEADAAIARIKGGEDFAAVAKAVSTDTGSGSKGGDLGCNPQGVFVPEFDKAANEAPLGQLSAPVQTQFGFHVLLVRERKEGTFEDSREQAKAALNAATQDAFRAFLQEAVTNAKVEVDKRYGTFAPPSTGQPPEVIPPVVPKPNTERTDTSPTTTPLQGELPGAPGNPDEKIGK